MTSGWPLLSSDASHISKRGLTVELDEVVDQLLAGLEGAVLRQDVLYRKGFFVLLEDLLVLEQLHEVLVLRLVEQLDELLVELRVHLLDQHDSVLLQLHHVVVEVHHHQAVLLLLLHQLVHPN